MVQRQHQPLLISLQLYRSYRFLQCLIVKFRSFMHRAIEAAIGSNSMIYLHPVIILSCSFKLDCVIFFYGDLKIHILEWILASFRQFLCFFSPKVCSKCALLHLLN